MEKQPDGTEIPGAEEKVVLSKEEFTELTTSIAESKQAMSNMTNELIELRKKGKEKEGQVKEIPAEDISKVVEAKLKERDREILESEMKVALAEFLDQHPEFSKEEDPDGSKFAAFQKALARINTNGVKTRSEYNEVLVDALRLMPNSEAKTEEIIASVPRSQGYVPANKNAVTLSPKEAKLVKENYSGNAEEYLKAKAKRPEYFEELLKWIR